MDLFLCLFINKIVQALEVHDLDHGDDWDVWPPPSVSIVMIQILQEWRKCTPVNCILCECKGIVDKILFVFLLKSSVEEITHTVTWQAHE